MAVIQDLVLPFCPTMHSIQQKKLKLLMPALFDKVLTYISVCVCVCVCVFQINKHFLVE